MTEELSRRRLLGGLGVGIAAGAGCLDEVDPRSASSEADGPAGGRVGGRVVDGTGDPIAEADVEAFRGGGEPIADAVTDDSGAFDVDLDAPAWLRVSRDGYLAQCRAVEPGDEAAFRLSPREGNVSLAFGGDTMFGRRFYETDDDPLSPRFRIDPDDLLESHREILRYASPALETADVASVNLETPLTTSEWRHPSKRYLFASHPVAARALAEAGVDYAALGNNHVFDALEPGLADTVDALDAAGLAHSGAGWSSREAWEPAIVERNGVRVAFVSCTTVVGASNEIEWSADRNADETYAVEQDGRTISFSGSVGAAEPTADRLRENVAAARENADVVVVQIHGGTDYERDDISEEIVRLTDAASEAGADLVVNHHPHVTGGVEYRNSTLVAWTIGNFVFDQELWQSVRSYLLRVDVGADGVVRAAVEPILLEGYVPKGVAGEPREKILRETAGRSTERMELSRTLLEDPPGDGGGTNREVETREFEGDGSIFARESGWVEELRSDVGTARLGRDRLLTGRFEDAVVDEERFEGPLWRYGRGTSPTIGSNFGYENTGGAKLTRHEGNEDRAVITPRHRLPVHEGSYTLTGLYRYNDAEGLELLVSWYDDRSGSSFTSEVGDLPGTDREWRRFVRHLDVPEGATHVDFFAFLSPPERSNVREASFDDVRLIEWTNDGGGREYDHLYVDGAAEADLAATGTEGEADGGENAPTWTELEP